MRVELLTGWNGNEAGAILELDPPVAELLLQRGVARVVASQKVQPTEVKKR